jgi:hypothetical protein
MKRFALWFAFAAVALLTSGSGLAEPTMSCPAGTYDMLDWMTLDSTLRSQYHLTGSANPLFTTMWSSKFYWTKGSQGYPWDIQLYDSNYIYLWITEYAWTNPTSFKKFTGTNMPLAPRCAASGYPGARIKVPNTTYEIHSSCSSYTLANLRYAVNEVWGPYYYGYGGQLPSNLKTMVVSYRYNCDSTYGNCADKEEYYLAKAYGLVEWVHYRLISGSYVQQQKSVFNSLSPGSTQPYFPCF